MYCKPCHEHKHAGASRHTAIDIKSGTCMI